MTTTHDMGLLANWFDKHDIPLDGPPRLELIAGGRSNLTYRVVDRAGARYVLRRPPFGHVLESAHDVGREYRIISALAASDVPVPRAYGLCSDTDVFDAPFYVMELVSGEVIATESEGAAYPAGARATASRNLVEVMARLHAVDVDAIGLGELSKKSDYSQRQLRRWQRQFHAATTRELPLVDALHHDLLASAPPQRRTGLVHGDFRPGNALLGRGGTVEAVLDWELATLGDTFADIGWMLANWRQPGEPELLVSPTANPGWLTRAEVAACYQEAIGCEIPDAHVRWYIAFAMWRLACISEGVYTRYREGAMGDDGYDVEVSGRLVVRLLETAREILDGAG